MKRFLHTALSLALILVAGGARAEAPFFTQVVTNQSLGVASNTGQLLSSTATYSSPYTSLYYSPSVGYNYSGGELLSQGGAYGSANTSGQLHAAAGETLYVQSVVGFPANVTAYMGNILTFSNPNATATTQTTVGFDVHLDGTLGSGGTGSGLADVALNVVIGRAVGNYLSGSSWAPTAVNVLQSYTGGLGFYASPSVVNRDLIGSFTFTGQTAIVPVFMSLFAGGQYDYADFSNTAAFAFNALPNGVSFTSASGDFGAPSAAPAPVPGAGFFSFIALIFARLRSRALRLLSALRARLFSGKVASA